MSPEELERRLAEFERRTIKRRRHPKHVRRVSVGMGLMVVGSSISLGYIHLPIESHLLQDVLAYFLHGVGAAAFIPALEPALFGVEEML